MAREYRIKLWTNAPGGRVPHYDLQEDRKSIEIAALALNHFYLTKEPFDLDSKLDIHPTKESGEQLVQIPVRDVLWWLTKQEDGKEFFQQEQGLHTLVDLAKEWRV
jgi:hypothetical protein